MKNLTDEAVFDAIAYSGASSYPWYHTYSIDEDAQRLRVAIEADRGHEIAVLTVGTLRRAFDALLEERYPGIRPDWDWDDEECDSNVDADIADCIIQQAVLGDVVFG